MGTYSMIQELCKKRKTSVRQVEIACGLSHGSISKWDKHKPSYDKAKKVADYFGVDVDALLYEEMHTSADPDQTSAQSTYYNDPETAKVAQAVFSDPNLRLLFDAAEDCSPDQVLLAAEMLKKFKEGR